MLLGGVAMAKAIKHPESSVILVYALLLSGCTSTMRRLLLAFICSGLLGCATNPEHFPPKRDVFPEATSERVSLSPAEVKAAISPANAFNLSKREKDLYAKKAKAGDIVAARKLTRFYFTNHDGLRRTKLDDQKADYWKSVVTRLERAASKARREK
jgi:hypothetical protein